MGVQKKCRDCKKSVPVATRNCVCGHQFFEERRKSTHSNVSESDELEVIGGVGAPSPGDMAMAGRGASGFAAGLVPGDANVPEGKRRSERVKREKPNFYDALEYENQMRKARKEKQKEQHKEEYTASGRVKRERKVKMNSEQEDDDDDEPVKEKKKKKKKKKKKDDKDDEEEEEIMAGISPEKQIQFGIVLSDINFKLGLNNPAFIKI